MLKMLKTKGRQKILAYVLTLSIFCTTLMVLFPTEVSAYDSFSTWKARYDSMLAELDTPEGLYGGSDTIDAAILGWTGAYVLDSLHRMYELTKDNSYISKMSQYINNMYDNLNDNDGDGYLGWGTDRYYNAGYREYIVHAGHVIQQWAKFILTVRNESTLASSLNPQGVTYASQADTLESVINSDLIPKWESYWSTEYDVYLNSWLADPNKSTPHNMYLVMSNALYLMSQVTPSNSHYKLWADRMTSNFKSFLTANGSAYSWKYWEHLTPADDHTIVSEDFSHASLDMDAAVRSYLSGGVFTENDLAMFANTLYDVMWNGSTTSPALSHSVDGSGTDDGYFICLEGQMERWRSGIWSLSETSTKNSWTTGSKSVLLQQASVIMQQHPGNASPQSFAITTPADGASNLDSSVNFSWQPSVNAADYTLQIATDSSFNSIVVSRAKIIGTNAIVPGLSHSTTYYWRVIARNTTGSATTSSVSSFTTKGPSSYTLSFSHLDSRNSSSPAGYHFMQALVDGVVVWERDVTADAANTWFTESVDITANCKGKSNVDVQLRLYDKNTISSYVVDVYWDDVSISNSDVTNGGFEKSALWYYSENSSGFSGGYSTTYKKSGSYSYKLSLPVSTASSSGKYAEVDQRFQLVNPTKYMLNLYTKDSRYGSLIGYHYKQVLIDGVVVWEQDAATDPVNSWINTYVDISPYVAGKSTVTVKLRLYDKNTISSYAIDTFWDGVSITNTGLQNGSFELQQNWTYEENLAGFNGAYDSSAASVGSQSYKIYLPGDTASSNGKYADIYQSCSVSN